MEKVAEEILKQFQCDYIRGLEESFAQTLSENENVRLFFINENEAFTDGRNIVVDPAVNELFCDGEALNQTGEYLKWPKVVLVDPWNALRIITRAQTIHECLHILYTDFPGKIMTDPKCSTKNRKLAMSLIGNIIEDAYIEAVGCSCYDNLDFYLKFGRVSRLFAANHSKGTAERAYAGADKKSNTLMEYLDYMAAMLLYPMVKLKEAPEEYREYVDKTSRFFYEGSLAASSTERYAYSSKIFDLIEPLIPEEDGIDAEKLEQKIGGTKTHASKTSTIGIEAHTGSTQIVTVRLFTDLNGKEREDTVPIEKLMKLLTEFAKEKNVAINIVTYEGRFQSFSGSKYDCSVIHKDIQIHENHPKINLNLRKAYQNIYNQFRININSYNSRFLQLLKAHAPEREDKYQFGSGIASKMLGDIKRRYWYRIVDGTSMPDMAVLLLIDGSGSMCGERQKSAMISSVILHEVLKRQGITHAIVEHRARFEDPDVDINILVDFAAREEEKYNLLQLDAYGDNRDGLALFWAESYLNQQTQHDYRLIIVLSDGVPAHEADEYYPPVSTADTANAVKKITKRGTDIIAISLDDEDKFDCYEQLKQIYPNLIACNNLKQLTGQVLGIIARLLQH